jgi:hypothetical protein
MVISDFLLLKKCYYSEYKQLLLNFDFPLIIFKYILLRLKTIISVLKCFIYPIHITWIGAKAATN